MVAVIQTFLDIFLSDKRSSRTNKYAKKATKFGLSVSTSYLFLVCEVPVQLPTKAGNFPLA